MTSFRQNIIICAVLFAGVKTYQNFTTPSIPNDYTGTADLICEGERYDLSADNKILDDTRQSVTPVTLKLAFQNGEITSWKAALTDNIREEDYPAANLLLSQFQSVCSRTPQNCAPTSMENRNTQLYSFNDRVGNVNRGGMGLLSKD